MKYVYYMRGSTAHELQIWRVVFRWCHLDGAYWAGWRFYRRFSVKYYPWEEGDPW